MWQSRCALGWPEIIKNYFSFHRNTSENLGLLETKESIKTKKFLNVLKSPIGLKYHEWEKMYYIRSCLRLLNYIWSEEYSSNMYVLKEFRTKRKLPSKTDNFFWSRIATLCKIQTDEILLLACFCALFPILPYTLLCFFAVVMSFVTISRRFEGIIITASKLRISKQVFEYIWYFKKILKLNKLTKQMRHDLAVFQKY